MFALILCLIFLAGCFQQQQRVVPKCPDDGPTVCPEDPDDPPEDPIKDKPQYQGGESVFGDFVLENVSYEEQDGKAYIIGDVYNTSTHNTYAWAEVEIVLTNDNMDHLKYIHTNTDQLKPGEMWPFIVEVPNITFNYYYIRDVYGSVQYNPNPLNVDEDLTIVEHGAINIGGTHQIIGTVENKSENRYAYVDILIYVYDENMNKVEQLQPSTTDFSPGFAWNFAVNITVPNAASYEIIEIYGY